MRKKERPKGKRGPKPGHGGRKPKLIDWDDFDRLAEVGCTLKMLAGYFGMTPEWLGVVVKEKYGETFLAQMEQKKDRGRSRLLGIQWDTALAGNVTMQIWLGKQHLGQRDSIPYREEYDPAKRYVILRPVQDVDPDRNPDRSPNPKSDQIPG